MILLYIHVFFDFYLILIIHQLQCCCVYAIRSACCVHMVLSKLFKKSPVIFQKPLLITLVTMGKIIIELQISENKTYI